MSWSLRIVNGDFSIGSQGLNIATGPNKLTQDLACFILEQMGIDSMHPTYGSLIDGGTDPNTGKYVPSIIGGINDAANAGFVKAEIQRICNAYQAMQVTRNANDVAIYGKSTLTADEALLSVIDINIQQVETNMLVNMRLQTGIGDVALTIPISVV